MGKKLSQPGQASKSKELKNVSKQVITPSILKEDKRKLELLYIIKVLNTISERALTTLLYEAKDKGLDLKYEFNTIGNNIFSPSIKEDITSLLYLGLIETDPATKKLKLSTDGEEALESNLASIDDSFKNQLNQILTDVKNKIVAIDEEYSLKLRSERRSRRR